MSMTTSNQTDAPPRICEACSAKARFPVSHEGRQLVHNAYEMFLTRIAKYNDPRNEEWDWDDVSDKWERHAFSAFRDLLAMSARAPSALAGQGSREQLALMFDELYNCYTASKCIAENEGNREEFLRLKGMAEAYQDAAKRIRATTPPSPALPSSISSEEYYEAQASADHEARVAGMDTARQIAERFVCNVDPANPLRQVLLRDLNTEEVAAIASIISAELNHPHD